MPPLRPGHLEEPHPARLSPRHPHRGEILQRHAVSVADGLATYRDPVSGLAVFTAAALAGRGWCCNSGCRHCPYLL